MRRSSLSRWVRLVPALLVVGMLVGATSGTASAGGGESVSIKLLRFRPIEPVVAPGEDVTVFNLDGDQFGEPHSLTAKNGEFDTGVFRSGSREFTAPSQTGVYPFYCVIHPFMRGLLHVRPDR